jgi:hypothetical protein
MSDQDEKIVFLTRELLDTRLPVNASLLDTAPQPGSAPYETTRVTLSFMTLCLTTFLASSGTNLITPCAHENGVLGKKRPLNRYEKVELEALILYAAKTKGLDEDNLRHDVETRIGVAHLHEITSADFAAARRYLQETGQ